MKFLRRTPIPAFLRILYSTFFILSYPIPVSLFVPLLGNIIALFLKIFSFGYLCKSCQFHKLLMISHLNNFHSSQVVHFASESRYSVTKWRFLTTQSGLSRCLPAPRRSAAVSVGSAAALRPECVTGTPQPQPLENQSNRHQTRNRPSPLLVWCLSRSAGWSLVLGIWSFNAVGRPQPCKGEMLKPRLKAWVRSVL
jgi:hypothetical protein